MTIVLGVLSVLAGIFVFKQGSVLSILSSMTNSNSDMKTSGAFLIVAICLIIAGLCGCICKNGDKKTSTICAAVFYILGTVFALVFKTGDLKLWAIVCAVMAVVYLFILYYKSLGKKPELSEEAQKALKAKEELYQKCVRAYDSAYELNDLIAIRKAFESCGDYKDTHAYISKLDSFIKMRKKEK